MKPVVDFTNRAEVADWLASVSARCYELADLAVEGTKPRRCRSLSKAALRQDVEIVFDELNQLCKAGRAGNRAPRRGA